MHVGHKVSHLRELRRGRRVRTGTLFPRPAFFSFGGVPMDIGTEKHPIGSAGGGRRRGHLGRGGADGKTWPPGNERLAKGQVQQPPPADRAAKSPLARLSASARDHRITCRQRDPVGSGRHRSSQTGRRRWDCRAGRQVERDHTVAARDLGDRQSARYCVVGAGGCRRGSGMLSPPLEINQVRCRESPAADSARPPLDDRMRRPWKRSSAAGGRSAAKRCPGTAGCGRRPNVALDPPEVAHPLHADQDLRSYGRPPLGDLRQDFREGQAKRCRGQAP